MLYNISHGSYRNNTIKWKNLHTFFLFISLSMYNFRLFIIFFYFLLSWISDFYLWFFIRKKKTDSACSRVNACAFAVNWSYSETRGIDILIKTSRMQVLIHMFSYSVLPPCLRHCAIHSRLETLRRMESWFFSFFLSCLFLPLFLPASLYEVPYKSEDTSRRASW